MNPSYNPPELICIGAAKDVVLGQSGPGNDLHNQYAGCHLEFESDEHGAVGD